LLVDAGLEHPASCDSGKELVGLCLLVECLVEQVLGIVEVEMSGERLSGSVCGNLVSSRTLLSLVIPRALTRHRPPSMRREPIQPRQMKKARVAGLLQWAVLGSNQ
jgi:hypothetical protein